MIPDQRLRALLRDHDDSLTKADPAFLEDLYPVLERERRRSRLRHLVPWPFMSLGPVAATGLLAVAIVFGVVASSYLASGNAPGVGGGVERPSTGPASSSSPSPGARQTPSMAPTPAASGTSVAGGCALAWDIPPAKGPIQHNLTGYGFAPGHEIAFTETAPYGGVNSETFVADATGTVVLGHYFWTDPLGARDQGTYEWAASDGACTATIQATVR